MNSSFVIDIKDMREKARQHIERGAVTEDYALDNEHVIDMLNQALATELLCSLRYKQHYHLCVGLGSDAIAEEFLEHSHEEQGHADALAERISQLGGSPCFHPDTLTSRSHSEYVVPGTINGMVQENLVAERVAIDSYRAMIRFIGDKDPTTRRILEEILKVEEEHADELADFLEF